LSDNVWLREGGRNICTATAVNALWKESLKLGLPKSTEIWPRQRPPHTPTGGSIKRISYVRQHALPESSRVGSHHQSKPSRGKTSGLKVGLLLFALGFSVCDIRETGGEARHHKQQASTAGDGALSYQMMDGGCGWRLSPRLAAAGNRFALQHSAQ